MGCLKFPRVKMYWNSFLALNVFTRNLSVNRFFALRNNFHVVDNLATKKEKTDKFKKLDQCLIV